MAAHGWRTNTSVAERLFREAGRFDFHQAVALLEALAVAAAEERGRPRPIGVGEGSDPKREAVRFAASVGFGFPPCDVVAVHQPDGGGAPDGKPSRAEMTVAFLSLVGGLGPMPEPIADLVQRSTVTRDFGPADFLDIFHHRLVSLRYRIKKLHRPALGAGAPDETRAASHLFALIGLFQPKLRAFFSDRGRSLLHDAGLLANGTRSMAGLTAILRHRFGVPVEAIPFTGCYRPIEPADRTRIGPKGANRRLGDTAVIGRRVWDQQGAFELCVGPLVHGELLRLLPASRGVPAGDMIQPFCEVVRFYAGPATEVTLRLAVEPQAAPQAALGKKPPPDDERPRRGNGPRLGYTAWIGRRRDHAPSLEVRLHPEDLRAVVA